MTVEKPKREVSKLSELKKPIVAGSGIAVVAIAGILTGLYFFSLEDGDDTHPEVVLNFGFKAIPDVIDPLQVWGEHDTYVLATIAEGLFDVNLTNSDSDIIGSLAVNHSWNENATELTCELKRGVMFHDGTPFNATAVKWNFDRIYRLISDMGFSYPELWLLPSGTPILNETLAIDEHTVKFVLNEPFTPFKALLACFSSRIVSPTSTPDNGFLDILSDKIIGTGPFMFDSFKEAENMSLLANQDYWNGKPQIDRINILEMPNFTYHVNALLTDKIDATRFAPKPYEYGLVSIRNDPSLTYQEAPRLNFRWIFMNNRKINVTMRKAISYAINYSIIDYLNYTRVKTPIPEPILYHNATGIKAPYLNLTIARQTLIDANWNGTAGLTANEDMSPGNEWEIIANSSYPLATYNFTFVNGFYDMEIIKDFLPNYLKQIGVKLIPVGIPGGQYWYRVLEIIGYHRNMFEISMGYWAADYNDPYNFIDPFYSNIGSYNAGQVNDSIAQFWMDQAIEETNTAARRQLYYQIQKHLVEEVFATTCFFSQYIADVYSTNIGGWHSNNFLMPFKNIYYKN